MNRHTTTAYSDKLIHIFMDPDPFFFKERVSGSGLKLTGSETLFFSPRYMAFLEGIPSGPTDQVCEVQGSVQQLPHQTLLHLKYTHYPTGRHSLNLSPNLCNYSYIDIYF